MADSERRSVFVFGDTQSPDSGTVRHHPAVVGWGKDSLSKYIEDAHENCMASYGNHRDEYDRLAKIDNLYTVLIDNISNTSVLTPLFVIRAHASFRGGAQLCLGGQICESYMLLRNCIEAALYGAHVSEDFAKQEAWLKRHDDEASKKLVRKEFGYQNVLHSFKLKDLKTAELIHKLYELSIDLGAHPNERAFLSQLSIESSGSRHTFTSSYLAPGEPPYRFCIKSAARTGICTLDVFKAIYPERYRILSLDVELDRLRLGL